jgi:hypothetical protein
MKIVLKKCLKDVNRAKESIITAENRLGDHAT